MTADEGHYVYRAIGVIRAILEDRTGDAEQLLREAPDSVNIAGACAWMAAVALAGLNGEAASASLDRLATEFFKKI